MIRLKPVVFCLIACLAVFLAFSCRGTPAASSSRPAEPRIQQPVFEITAIVIMQAELINTRLKVKVKITNPNPFPVDLSLFQYELYGAGRFWADGTEKDVLTIPAGEAAEKDLFLVMNFINMRRELLDQVIAMNRVRYRFAGSVQIAAALEDKEDEEDLEALEYLKDLPAFTSNFNLQGESEVTK
jgi:LEA14-like dessication related protein